MRLAVLSNENLNPWINWSTLGPPLLRPLAAREGAELVAPPPLATGSLPAWPDILRRLWNTDTLFWMQGSARPEYPIWAASFLRGMVRRSAFVVDAWKPSIGKIGALAVAQRLNPCFVPFLEGCEALRKRFPGGRFEWLPWGVDTVNFDAPEGGKRDIFAYWMGRRHEPLHQAMLRYCQRHGLEYRYTKRPGEFGDPAELGRFIGRCQYFMVTPPDLDNPARTGGFSPFVMRYLEGLSVGARLLGVLPSSGEYQLLLPRDAILEVAPDGSDLAERLDADHADPSARAAVARARALVRHNHSWARRADQIYARLSLGQKFAFDLPTALEAARQTVGQKMA
jgi:hypothetical protein